MISFSNPKPKTWQEFSEWMRGLKIDNIEIDHDYLNDTITVRNKDTRMNQRISRFVLDHMDPELRQETFLQMIANTMKNPQGGITTTGAITQGTYTISSGGAAGFGNAIRGAMGNVAVIDDPHASLDPYRDALENGNLKDKLFSDGERLQIMEVKKSIRSHIKKHMPTYDFDMSGVVVAGGCFASMMNDEVVKDFDIFLLNNSRNELALNLLASNEFTSNPTSTKINGKEYIKNDKIEKTVSLGRTALQYIYTKYNTRKELIDSFDFKHCCVSYDYANDKLFISREVFDLIKSKTLEHNTDKPPAYWRYEKFWQRGWKSEIAIVTD